MQDIVPRKSIRDIDKSAITRGVTPRTTSVPQQGQVAKNVSFVPPKEQMTHKEEYTHTFIQEHKESHFWKYVFIFLVLILGMVAVYLHTQRQVTVYITPHTASVVLQNTQLTIPHEKTRVIEHKKEVEIPIVSSGTKTVEKKAQGTVIVYNKNTQSQVLVAGTRLETNDGKVFTLNTRVSVPPVRNGVPGSIQVIVTAQNTGSEYNITATDFTVPGLRGSARFTQVYGRSVERFQGGSKEEVSVYDEKIVNTALEKSIRETKNELEEKIKKDTNQDEQQLGVIIWSTNQDISTFKAKITVEGKQRVIAISALATQIAEEENIQTIRTGATTDAIQNIRVTIESASASTTKISLNGEIALRGLVSHEELKQAVTNKPFETFNTAIKSIGGIKEARFSSRPFWIGTFPQENKIVIIEK